MANWFQGLRKLKGAAARAHAAGSVAKIRVKGGAKALRMIILPARGLRAPHDSVAPAAARNFLSSLALGVSTQHASGGASAKMKVIDAVHEDGAKLVEMTPDAVMELRAIQPGLRVIPEAFYRPAVQVCFAESVPAAAGKGTRSVTLAVRSAADGAPVKDVMVVGFTDFAAREGAQGVTSAGGTVTLKIPSRVKKFERVYAYPEIAYWGALAKNVQVAASIDVKLTPIDLSYVDCLRHFYGGGAPDAGNGVKVSVIDSGIALNHPDLTVAGGECTIPGENAGDFGPLGGPHGSHVAGIIAGHGVAPSGVRGVAPAASLYSLRVFGAGEGASNYSIIKAIDRAVALGCDLVNMSLGGGPRDAALESAIGDAYLAGTVCIVAAGNDYRSPVSVPAAYQLSVAVSACGRKGTFPAGTTESGDVAPPYGRDKNDFIAAFSNVGAEIDVTGPGVGVISSVPGGYGVMSGTSMACPAVTGLAARLLSLPANAAILSGARDESRSNEIVQMLLQSCKKLGFGRIYEGLGLPRG